MTATVVTSPRRTAPYRRHERVSIAHPSGMPLQARVEQVVPLADGGYSLVASVTEPRRLRSSVVTVTLGADGDSTQVRRTHRR